MDFDFISYGLKYINIPEKYDYNESQIAISGKFYELYQDFINFLNSEKKLEYMVNSSKEKKFVEGELDKFVLDVLLDKKYHKNPSFFQST